ncbi:TetR/AcrR family transcriptional regulator [Alcanivorax sp. 24]|uniref:TetR/AcrR family transcriptional regulator n=1 Tax=Alcanivorax sp. 24 TaxID=2545266 RepID=UPI0010615064|nr:TetR/AcrR family transcriptional regulator [Alcanivorax sp. 24]
MSKTQPTTTKGRRRSWGGGVQTLEEQREAREKILLETAAKLFNRYGFHGTSLSMLTEELGLTKGALYHYVKDKGDLLYKIHIKSAEATSKAVKGGIEEGTNGFERVRAIVRLYLTSVTRSQIETFLYLEDGALSEEQAVEVRALRRNLEHSLREQVQYGIDDGSIAPCDPALATFTLIGAMAWVSKWYKRDGPWTSQQLAEGMAELLGRMLRTGNTPSLPLSLRDT